MVAHSLPGLTAQTQSVYSPLSWLLILFYNKTLGTSRVCTNYKLVTLNITVIQVLQARIQFMVL